MISQFLWSGMCCPPGRALPGAAKVLARVCSRPFTWVLWGSSARSCWSEGHVGPLSAPCQCGGAPLHRELLSIRGSRWKSRRGWPRQKFSSSCTSCHRWQTARYSCCIVFARSQSVGLGRDVYTCEYQEVGITAAYSCSRTSLTCEL